MTNQELVKKLLNGVESCWTPKMRKWLYGMNFKIHFVQETSYYLNDEVFLDVEAKDLTKSFLHEVGHLVDYRTNAVNSSSILEELFMRDYLAFCDRNQFLVDSHHLFSNMKKVCDFVYLTYWLVPECISDGLGILSGKGLPGYASHNEGYPKTNFATEMFAEFFAARLLSEGDKRYKKWLYALRQEFPSTYFYLKKKVEGLWK